MEPPDVLLIALPALSKIPRQIVAIIAIAAVLNV
jgi:hypothetical protein